MDSLLTIAPPTDPVSATALAVQQLGKAGEEYFKFLQTPAGQEVAKEQLKDWVAIKNGFGTVGDLVKQALETITKEKK